MKKLIIFGTGKISDVAYRYFFRGGKYTVIAFTCDHEHIDARSHFGLPVVPFDTIEQLFPPEEHDFFVAIGYHDLNRVRAEKCRQAKAKGYVLASLICDNSFPKDGIAIGENCLVLDNVSVQPGSQIGNDVFLWSNVVVGHHTKIGDHCWLASGTVIGGASVLEERCFLALNTTVGNEVVIGRGSLLGARTLLTKSLPENSVLIEKDTDLFKLDSERFLKISKLR